MSTATIRTGYEVRAGAEVLADRFADLARCECGEILAPSGKCLDVGSCRHADRGATRQSLSRGAAASSRSAPAAWTIGGRVD